MNRQLRALILLLAVLLVTSCAQPTLDVSSPEALKASSAAMREALPAEKRAAFTGALNAISNAALDREMAKPKGAEIGDWTQLAVRPLNGLTADQIIQRGVLITLYPEAVIKCDSLGNSRLQSQCFGRLAGPTR